MSRGLSDAAEYAIAQARERLAEQKRTNCRCGVPRDECGQHKHQATAELTHGDMAPETEPAEEAS